MVFNNMHEDWEKEAPRLAGMKRETPFSVPENYFDSLAQDIESRLITERLRESIKTEGFTVPAGYFESLERAITKKTNAETSGAKIKKLHSGWVKYAAAACITIAVSFTIFINLKNNNLHSQLHKIPENEIVTYLQLTADAGDTPVIIENLGQNSEILDLDLNGDISQEDIEAYINSTTL